MAAINDYQTYKEVLRKRIVSLKRKVATSKGYARTRLLGQLQEMQRLLKERS
jgi:hypothetical protein